MSKNKEKKVVVVDKTKDPVEAASAAPSQVDAAKAAIASLTDEEKAQLLAQMGLTKKGSGKSKARAQFKVASESLFGAMPEIQAILDKCEFPAPFALSVGRDHEGNFNANLKRLRKRDKKEPESAE